MSKTKQDLQIETLKATIKELQNKTGTSITPENYPYTAVSAYMNDKKEFIMVVLELDPKENAARIKESVALGRNLAVAQYKVEEYMFKHVLDRMGK